LELYLKSTTENVAVSGFWLNAFNLLIRSKKKPLH
jgi:hypothetical protein